jgi:hypothetical protein
VRPPLVDVLPADSFAIAVGANFGMTLSGACVAADGAAGVVSPTLVEVIVVECPALVVVILSTRVYVSTAVE